MKLFSEFPHSSAEEWEKKIIQDLKIKSLNDITKQNGSLRTLPFYTEKDLTSKITSVRTDNGWETCESIFVNNEKEANQLALEALKGGASGLVFNLPKQTDLKTLLKNISIEHIYTQFNISNDSLHAIKDLNEYYLKPNKFNKRSTCFVNLDPLYLLAKFGEWHESEEKDLSQIKALKHITVNAVLYKESGADVVNELAFTLTHLNEYFNYLGEKKLKESKYIHLSFSQSNDFFTEIAKLRAIRKLVALLQKAWEIKIPLHLHSQTALLNKSSMDAYTNLLRTSTESMSAVLGGSDSVSVLPFNEGFSSDKNFSNRIARNQLHILKEESYLDKVADIAYGSYYIENLTETIAQQAWNAFKEIEKNGGFLAGLKTGELQKLISDNAKILQADYLENKKTLVGVNKFQNKNEKNIAVKSKAKFNKKDVEPFETIRLAHKFEEQISEVKITGN